MKGIKKTKRLYNIGAERGTIPRLLLGKFKCNTIKKKKKKQQKPEKVVQLWICMPRKALTSLSLEVFLRCPGKATADLV